MYIHVYMYIYIYIYIGRSRWSWACSSRWAPSSWRESSRAWDRDGRPEYAYVYIYIYIYTYMDTHTHIHLHTHTHSDTIQIWAIHTTTYHIHTYIHTDTSLHTNLSYTYSKHMLETKTYRAWDRGGGPRLRTDGVNTYWWGRCKSNEFVIGLFRGPLLGAPSL